MKKDEILELSRKENKKKDAFETEVSAKAATYGCIATTVLATIYFCYEIFIGRGTNPAFYSLVTIANTFIYGYKGIKLKEKRGLYIFNTVVWGLLTVMLIVEYFWNK